MNIFFLVQYFSEILFAFRGVGKTKQFPNIILGQSYEIKKLWATTLIVVSHYHSVQSRYVSWCTSTVFGSWSNFILYSIYFWIDTSNNHFTVIYLFFSITDVVDSIFKMENISENSTEVIGVVGRSNIFLNDIWSLSKQLNDQVSGDTCTYMTHDRKTCKIANPY